MRANKNKISLDILTKSLPKQIYNELDVLPLRDNDPLEVLHSNLQRLQDLQARSAFLSKEVRYILKLKI